MSDKESSGQVLRSAGIIGGSSAMNVLVGLVRIKVAALILGPAGVGLIGLFHNLIATCATVASYGIGNVTVRQIAAAKAEDGAAARRALAWAAFGLALAGTLITFLLREPIAVAVFASRQWSDEVGWLAMGVGLTVLAFAQNGMLVGLRRIGDVARVSIWSAFLGSAAAVAALLVWREKGLLAFVLVSPLVTFLVGAYFLRRAPRPSGPRPSLAALSPHWRALAGLGLAFTVGSVAAIGSQLAIRSLVQRQLGTDSLGYFQASWAISMNYIGFVTAAMSTDYYPRLSAVIGDPDAARRTVNQQAELALLLAGPLLVGVTGLAPWLIPLLYTSEFLPAVELLRWQIWGDLFKMASWPLAFIMLAAGRGRVFAVTEVASVALLVGTTALLLPAWGLQAPGIAYLIGYAVYLPVVYALARGSIGSRLSREAVEAFLIVALALGITAAASWASPTAGAVAAVTLGAALAWLAAARLRGPLLASDMAAVTNRLGRLRRRSG